MLPLAKGFDQSQPISFQKSDLVGKSSKKALPQVWELFKPAINGNDLIVFLVAYFYVEILGLRNNK